MYVCKSTEIKTSQAIILQQYSLTQFVTYFDILETIYRLVTVNTA
jgi:hypothetical protein